MAAVSRWARRVLMAAGALLLTVTFTPLVFVWASALSDEWNDPREGVLIVLAGRSLPDVLADSTYWRTVHGVRQWRQGRFSHMVVSGSGVAPLMKEFAVGCGVPADAIITEELGDTTRNQADRVREIVSKLPPGPRVLVTSDFHMLRARRTFEKAGLSVVPMPIPDHRKRYNQLHLRMAVFWELVEETTKLAGYRIRGWI